MSARDRNILLVVPAIVALIAVWLLVVSPKQDQVKKLDAQVSQAQDALTADQQAISQGVSARKAFPRAYHRLVVSGKAVPVQNETASLLVQIDRAASASGVVFQEIDGPDSSGGSSSASPDSTTAATTSPTTTTVGGASLTSAPYNLTFKGTFFQIADFISRMDRLVKNQPNRVPSDGRLTLITGFSLGPDEPAPLPALLATLSVSTYTAGPSSDAASAAAAGTSSTTVPTTTDSTSSTSTTAPTSTDTSTPPAATTASAPTSP